MNRYVVMQASAPVPSSWQGWYLRFAVVEVDPEVFEETEGKTLSLISPRARGVVGISATWERRYRGNLFPLGTCEASCALREATDLAETLNERNDQGNQS